LFVYQKKSYIKPGQYFLSCEIEKENSNNSGGSWRYFDNFEDISKFSNLLNENGIREKVLKSSIKKLISKKFLYNNNNIKNINTNKSNSNINLNSNINVNYYQDKNKDKENENGNESEFTKMDELNKCYETYIENIKIKEKEEEEKEKIKKENETKNIIKNNNNNNNYNDIEMKIHNEEKKNIEDNLLNKNNDKGNIKDIETEDIDIEKQNKFLCDIFVDIDIENFNTNENNLENILENENNFQNINIPDILIPISKNKIEYNEEIINNYNDNNNDNENENEKNININNNNNIQDNLNKKVITNFNEIPENQNQKKSLNNQLDIAINIIENEIIEEKKEDKFYLIKNNLFILEEKVSNYMKNFEKEWETLEIRQKWVIKKYIK
jgi:hypothetical protein